MTRGGSALNLRTSTIRPLFFLKRETNKKKEPVGSSLDSDILMKMTKKSMKVWKIKEKCLSLQHERNLFWVRAPVGPASDLLK